jgi:hypothetical protein
MLLGLSYAELQLRRLHRATLLNFTQIFAALVSRPWSVENLRTVVSDEAWACMAPLVASSAGRRGGR